jgi:hypothetical protein
MNKTLCEILIVSYILTASANADFDFADSPAFYLNLLTQRGAHSFDSSDSPAFALNLLSTRGAHSFDSSDSPAFTLNLLGIRRAWADSPEFPYMWANADLPPDPNVLVLRPAGNLKLVDPNIIYIYPDKPTIILTHGWNPNYSGCKTEPGSTPEWVSQMGGHMLSKPWGPNHNILWWDWLETATAYSPAGPAKEACRQGNALADALLTTLGTDYNQPVHFIGHSLGTAVNRYAVDVVHLNGWNSANTHVTISDSAEIGDLALLVRPIPNQAAWIDSYITAFGDLHSEAANVILRQGMPIMPSILGLIQFHAYSWRWYDWTVQDPNGSIMGNKWSFENGGLSGAPSVGTCYVQTANPFDNQLNLEWISWNDAQWVMGGRTLLLVGQGGFLCYDAVRSSILLLGKVVLDTTYRTIKAKLQEVPPGGSASIEGFSSMNLIAEANETASSYMWVPIEIPPGKDLLSFEYKFTGTSDDDYMTVAIDDKQIFAIEAQYVADNNDYVTTSYIDISGYSGQVVELLIAFNADDVPGGELDVRNFQFHSTAVQTDLDADGLVNFNDFSRLAAQWERTDCNDLNAWCNKSDFDRTGYFDSNDIGIFSNDWLRDAADPNTW